MFNPQKSELNISGQIEAKLSNNNSIWHSIREFFYPATKGCWNISRVAKVHDLGIVEDPVFLPNSN